MTPDHGAGSGAGTPTRIRRAERADLPHLRRIQTATLAEPAPDLLRAAAADGPPALFVADDGQPVGYVLLVTGEVAYLPELAVAPARQEEGIGTALVDAVVADLCGREDGPDRLRVTARADDDRARGFYESRGFEVVERLPDFFESAAGVAMVREL
ncbi:MAG: N-acetyltransferase [Haloarculaceae archaeon]